MAEARATLFQDIYDSRPGMTSADQLWELARRREEGKRLRVTRADAKEFLKDSGRAQIYKDVAVQWPGKIQRPTETDVLFDLDGTYGSADRRDGSIPLRGSRSLASQQFGANTPPLRSRMQ